MQKVIVLVVALLTAKITGVTIDDNGTPADPTDDQATLSWDITSSTGSVLKSDFTTMSLKRLKQLDPEDVKAMLRGKVDEFRSEQSRTPTTDVTTFNGLTVDR